MSRDPTAKFDLVFNLKTANAFGLTIAQLSAKRHEDEITESNPMNAC